MEVILSRPDGSTILFLQACQSGQQERAMKYFAEVTITPSLTLRALKKCWKRGHLELAQRLLTTFLQQSTISDIFGQSVVQGLSKYRQAIPETLPQPPKAIFEGMWRRQPPESPATILAYHQDNQLDSWRPNKPLYLYLGRWGQLESIEALAKISGPDVVYPPIRETALLYGRTTLIEAIHFLHPMPLTKDELSIIVERGDVNLVGRLRQCHLLTDANIEYILSEVSPTLTAPVIKNSAI